MKILIRNGRVMDPARGLDQQADVAIDGGKVLEAWLTPLFGGIWALRVVAVCGLAVGAWLAWRSFPGSMFMLMLAVLIAMQNWQVLQSAGGLGRR